MLEEVRGSALLVGSAVDLGAQAVALVRQEKFLWAATMDRNIACYSSRGKRLKGMILSEDIAELCIMSLKKAKVNYLLLVALATGEICMYRELTLIHSFKVRDREMGTQSTSALILCSRVRWIDPFLRCAMGCMAARRTRSLSCTGLEP